MTKTHQMILNELNKAYESEPSQVNSNKLIMFVEDELSQEKREALSHRTNVYPSEILFMIIICALVGVISMVLVHPFVSEFNPFVGVGSSVVMWLIFDNKIHHCFIKRRYCSKKYEYFKIFDLYFQAKDLKIKKDFEDKEQQLISKYLDRNGNAVEVEKFECDNPKDTIIVEKN